MCGSHTGPSPRAQRERCPYSTCGPGPAGSAFACARASLSATRNGDGDVRGAALLLVGAQLQARLVKRRREPWRGALTAAATVVVDTTVPSGSVRREAFERPGPVRLIGMLRQFAEPRMLWTCCCSYVYARTGTRHGALRTLNSRGGPGHFGRPSSEASGVAASASGASSASSSSLKLAS